MSAHVRELLYEFAAGDVSATDRERVRAHLSTCPSCAADLETIFGAMAVLPRPVTPPGEERDAAFWIAFANGIEAKIRSTPPARHSFPARLRDVAIAFVSANSGTLLVGAGTLAVAAAAILLLWQEPPSTANRLQDADSFSARPVTRPPVENASLRMNDYLKKSRVLLVGITNMKTDGETVDLSPERKQSRELIHEAQYLRRQPLDARSAKLIGDLDRILIELANIEESRDLPNVELIRTGIRKENLLFKIRMTENLMQAGYTERNYQ